MENVEFREKKSFKISFYIYELHMSHHSVRTFYMRQQNMLSLNFERYASTCVTPKEHVNVPTMSTFCIEPNAFHLLHLHNTLHYSLYPPITSY